MTLLKKKFYLLCLLYFFTATSAFAALSITPATTSISLSPGLPHTFVISGGTGFYKISSSDNAVATASLSGPISADAKIEGLSSGNATLSIEDSAGEKITIDVLVVTASAGFTASPSKITLASPGDTATSVLSDTNIFYQVSSSDEAIATAAIYNNIITITACTPGAAVISVTSNNSQTVAIDVTVSDKNIISLASGEIKNFDMAAIGGNGFYQASITDDAIASIGFTGNQAQIFGVNIGTTDILITDSDSKTFNLNIVVYLEPPLLNVNIKGDTVTLSWSDIVSADSYIIYYAQNDAAGNPVTNNIQFTDVGKLLSLDIDLPSGASYSAAVQAIHTQSAFLSSPASNIESFTIQ